MRLRRDNLTWHIAGDDVVVLDLSGSVYLRVSGSGRVLWERLAEFATIEELAGLLVEQYDISSEQASADVSRFLEDLHLRNLLETP